jgi:O-antigen ligase
VLGYYFWNAHVGPLPLTLDRLLLIGMVAAFVAQWRWGRIERKPLTGTDWLLAAMLVVLTASTIFAGTPDVLPKQVSSPMWRLVMSFLVPATLYWVLRQAPLSHRAWCTWLAVLTGLGVYLSLTAVAEVANAWGLVFPRYIADPKLGIHFGRARGPDLNSASLGVYVTMCLWCAWTLRPQVSRAWQLVLLASIPLMALAVFFTYTRSTWIGLLASAAVVGFLELPRAWRLPLFSLAGLAGMLVAAVAWNDVVGLEREGSAGESHHSVDQRTSFAYVSWQMFRDNPVLGVGFGRFYDRKMPYLSDRSQQFELESLRELHHHNTLLSVLVETGLIGLAAFVAVLVALARNAWQLARDPRIEGWMRSQGVLMLAVLVTYLSSAVFHDLTLLPSQQWLLFAFAGLTMNLRLSAMQPRATAVQPIVPNPLPRPATA